MRGSGFRVIGNEECKAIQNEEHDMISTFTARKAALFLFSVAVPLLGGVEPVRAQSALDGLDPSANDYVGVVVVQPDGKTLIGGGFTSLQPNGGLAVTRNRIARLNPDGTLDVACDPNANGRIFAIALQGDGKILVGGDFTNIGGQTRNYIARLDPTTGLADSLNPNANSPVNSITLQPDGKILVGGGFITIGGQPRSRIARLDPTTGLADSFDPSANNYVYSFVVQSDGKILVGGQFTTLSPNGGATVTRNRIARLNPSGTLDTAFNPNATGVGASGEIYSIAVQADGKILVVGGFISIGGQTRYNIARLDSTTGLADSFDPNPGQNGIVRSIAVRADGKILVGGDFTSIGGQPRKAIARLDPNTGLADSLDSNLGNTGNTATSVYGIALQADGKIWAGGTFDLASGQSRKQVARLETDGRLDRTLNLSMDGSVLAIAVQPGGKTVIGGDFTTVLGVSRNNIARLNTDGTLDPAFNPNIDDAVESIVVQMDGKILVGGAFITVGGQTRNRIARLDATTGSADSFDPNANDTVYSVEMQADGKILAGGAFTALAPNGGALVTRNHIARLDAASGSADSFDPNASGTIQSIAVQADGKILAGGFFNSIGGQPRNYIARLNPTTGLADSFNPNATSQVQSIAVQADGKILVGGLFQGPNSIGGQTRNYIARLNPTTGLADSFNPNATSQVQSIAVQADGKILVGGLFQGPNSIGGQTRNYIARLDPTTGLADSFDPNADQSVYSIAVQTDGKISAGGFFAGIGGQPRAGFARLTNDTAALQNLAVTQTAITWTRGGASPDLTRVTFEASTDNVSYSPLGNGTASGNNWTLTGLNLPSGQNIYIRARGYYCSGYLNSSSSITESVRNALIVGPPGTPIPTATPTPTPPATPTATATATAAATPTATASPSPTPTATAVTATPSPTPPYLVILWEGFDAVTAPALPTGWVTSFIPGPANCEPTGTCPLGTDWATSTSTSQTAPNSAFHDSPGCVTDSRLDTPSMFVPPNNYGVDIIFWHNYNLQAGFDGGVLEMSINGGPFTDFVAAGGTFINSSGYNGTISTAFLSPIAGRAAWTGNSGGYTRAWGHLGPSPHGYHMVLRFRLGTDCSGAGTGWSIDSIAVNYNAGDCCPTPTATATATAMGTPTPTPTPPPVCDLTEGFNAITTLVPSGWVIKNNSQSGPGPTNWFQGNPTRFPSQSGASNSYIAADFNNGIYVSTLSDWLLTPPLTLQNGAQLSFWTRTVTNVQFPDRLQVRMSTNGASQDVGSIATDVGDFTTLLLDINPTYTTSGYPNVWTQFTVTVSGLGSPTTGRLAFRYFVENGGPYGTNSDYIGIDTMQYVCTGPTPTPTPTPISISGTVSYCSNPALPPVPGVTMTLTGTSSGSTLTDGSGNYTFSFLAAGGSYTVTPTKTALASGSAGINTIDVVATQRQFLNMGTPLTGCALTAADVNGDSSVNTIDVVAIQRFFLSQTTGIANVGKYQFNPASRSYPGVVTNQTGQTYNALVFGDVASGFVNRREGPSQPAAGGEEMGAREVLSTVAVIALPEVTVDRSRSNVIGAVKTTEIDARNKLVGF
jgi:uncharacterized delta-60 repeat protein